MTERDTGLASSSIASAIPSLAYPPMSLFAARPACPGTQWIKVTILLSASTLMLATHWSIVS